VAQNAVYVAARAREEIVNAKHIALLGDKPLAKMRANKPAAPSDKNPLPHDA
jgi:hypothetical protein